MDQVYALPNLRTQISEVLCVIFLCEPRVAKVEFRRFCRFFKFDRVCDFFPRLSKVETGAAGGTSFSCRGLDFSVLFFMIRYRA